MSLSLVFSLACVIFLVGCQCVGCHYPDLADQDRLHLRNEVREMFYHAYNSYMDHAFPKDELLPLSCNGEDTFGSYSLTLIDTMDTLVVMGDVEEFSRGVEWLLKNTDFNKDVNVSVFETSIRVVGGLLSAHLLALDFLPSYGGGLLLLALDVAERLLPAFDTPTGLPYGTVNLRFGVPQNETTVTSVAGTNTYSLEFGLLSYLTGNSTFKDISQRSLDSLWEKRSSLGLMGNHIDVFSGTWTHADATIGTAVDSFYEYLLKAGILFQDSVSMSRFREAYDSIMASMFKKPWYMTVDMNSGAITWATFDALSAFWPGLQVLAGDLVPAGHTLTAFMQIWTRFGVTPELLHFMSGQIPPNRANYPLRPELAESLYYMWMATHDPYWRHTGRQMVYSIQNLTRVDCGYAGVADVHLHRLEDQMNSFFLAETLKYLYLLFDDDNFVNYGAGNYIFNTEGHIFPILWQRFIEPTRSRLFGQRDDYRNMGMPASSPDHRHACSKMNFFTAISAGSLWPVPPSHQNKPIMSAP